MCKPWWGLHTVLDAKDEVPIDGGEYSFRQAWHDDEEYPPDKVRRRVLREYADAADTSVLEYLETRLREIFSKNRPRKDIQFTYSEPDPTGRATNVVRFPEDLLEAYFTGAAEEAVSWIRQREAHHG